MKRFFCIHPIAIVFLASAFFLYGCSKKGGSNPTPPNTTPTITSLSVNQGPYSTSVVISGTNFSSTVANDQVFFNGKAATITAATTTQLTAAVPLGAGSGNVTVSVNGGTVVSGPAFTYQLSLVVSILAGSGAQGAVDGTGTAASFNNPYGITVDALGNIYVCDTQNNKIRKITPDGVVTTFAGNGSSDPDNGTTTASNLSNPMGLAFDAQGNLYVTEYYNDVIRKITPSGVVSTLAGSKYIVNVNDPFSRPADGLGTAASFDGPAGIAIDVSGNLYVPEVFSNLIRKVTPAGLVSTYAGIINNRVAGSPLNGPASSATFDFPSDVKMDATGNLYVADHLNNMIRKITPGGVVSPLAGTGVAGSADGPGAAATFKYVSGIALDNSGNILVADVLNSLIRKVTPEGVVSTLAGSTVGSADGPALTAKFKTPNSLAIDAAGNIYVSDSGDNRIRKISMQ